MKDGGRRYVKTVCTGCVFLCVCVCNIGYIGMSVLGLYARRTPKNDIDRYNNTEYVIYYVNNPTHTRSYYIIIHVYIAIGVDV